MKLCEEQNKDKILAFKVEATNNVVIYDILSFMSI